MRNEIIDISEASIEERIKLISFLHNINEPCYYANGKFPALNNKSLYFYCSTSDSLWVGCILPPTITLKDFIKNIKINANIH